MLKRLAALVLKALSLKRLCSNRRQGLMGVTSTSNLVPSLYPLSSRVVFPSLLGHYSSATTVVVTFATFGRQASEEKPASFPQDACYCEVLLVSRQAYELV